MFRDRCASLKLQNISNVFVNVYLILYKTNEKEKNNNYLQLVLSDNQLI